MLMTPPLLADACAALERALRESPAPAPAAHTQACLARLDALRARLAAQPPQEALWLPPLRFETEANVQRLLAEVEADIALATTLLTQHQRRHRELRQELQRRGEQQEARSMEQEGTTKPPPDSRSTLPASRFLPPEEAPLC
jgi:hypothetical protein